MDHFSEFLKGAGKIAKAVYLKVFFRASIFMGKIGTEEIISLNFIQALKN